MNVTDILRTLRNCLAENGGLGWAYTLAGDDVKTLVEHIDALTATSTANATALAKTLTKAHRDYTSLYAQYNSLKASNISMQVTIIDLETKLRDQKTDDKPVGVPPAYLAPKPATDRLKTFVSNLAASDPMVRAMQDDIKCVLKELDFRRAAATAREQRNFERQGDGVAVWINGQKAVVKDNRYTINRDGIKGQLEYVVPPSDHIGGARLNMPGVKVKVNKAKPGSTPTADEIKRTSFKGITFGVAFKPPVWPTPQPAPVDKLAELKQVREYISKNMPDWANHHVHPFTHGTMVILNHLIEQGAEVKSR